MKDLEARKKALAAEAEVYRQAIKLEVQNLKIYAETRKARYSRVDTGNPLITAAMPILTAMLTKKKRPWSKLISGALLGWKFYSKVLPELRGMWSASEGSRYHEEEVFSRF